MQQVRAKGGIAYSVEDILRSQTGADAFEGQAMAAVYPNKTLLNDVAMQFYWQARPQSAYLRRFCKNPDDPKRALIMGLAQLQSATQSLRG